MSSYQSQETTRCRVLELMNQRKNKGFNKKKSNKLAKETLTLLQFKLTLTLTNNYNNRNYANHKGSKAKGMVYGKKLDSIWFINLMFDIIPI